MSDSASGRLYITCRLRLALDDYSTRESCRSERNICVGNVLWMRVRLRVSWTTDAPLNVIITVLTSEVADVVISGVAED